MKHSLSEYTNNYYNIAYNSEVTMNIFQRLKEIVTNRQILAEQEKLLSQLEHLVEDIDPTAEFNKTMYAEEYIQTIALEENLKHL